MADDSIQDRQDNDLQERQDNELEALKAIFGEQVHERERFGCEWTPLDIVLSLGPQQGSIPQEAHTVIDLHIVCSDKYPDEVPIMTVEKSKGLSTQQLEVLLNNLSAKAEAMKGEEMIFELASIAQTFLHQYNRPGFESLYDEMFSRQLKKQQKEEELKKFLEDKTRQEVLLEIENKKEALKQESRWRRNSEILKDEDDNFTQRIEVNEPVAHKPLLTADLLESDDSNQMKFNEATMEDFSPWSISPKGVSRLENEFEMMQFLGKGAFGDVLMVRNKLDRCLYAIKRIELNPMNKLLYKKITREVKLLSRLNHENVVRYFNSWIETIAQDNYVSSPLASKEEIGRQAVDLLPLNEVSVEWDCSKRKTSESSNDSSDDNCWITFLPGSSGSTSEIDSTKLLGDQNPSGSVPDTSQESVTNGTQQFMYIQMEFCEKSTLRMAIDDGLYQDDKRVWRLLREIVEGLGYIHQQGIIHRDLKPVNVFIDSEDHVKIGDFGLATTNIISKNGIVFESSHNQSVGDTSHTGQVGTALYVAPELNSSCLKVTYNQKVDVYSLGVMFFEMCYRPLQTAMERIKVLADLRQDECILPADFEDSPDNTRKTILRWMLTHDPVHRPGSAELLQSELLPPPQFEERELQDLMRRTINNPQSKIYKYLIASCFNQKMSTAQNVTYDMSVNKGRWFISLLQEIVEKIRRVLQLHGAVSLVPPLLVPSGTMPPSPSVVSLMTRWGGVAQLPHDLRLPLARFLAHNPTISRLKRYAIDRVYREQRVLGHHPRELNECAFDIVTPPTGVILADAEILVVISQIMTELPPQIASNCLLRVNHSCLLRAALSNCGVEASKHHRISALLAHKEEVMRARAVEGREGWGLADCVVTNLEALLEQEYPVNRASSALAPLLQQCSANQHAFRHLERVVNTATHLGLKCAVVVAPGLASDTLQYSGLLVQVVWEHRSRQGRSQRTVIAAGGRYDQLIAYLRQEGEEQERESQCAIGVSLALDRLVLMLQEDSLHSPADAVVCSLGSQHTARDALALTRDLWAVGVRTYLLDSLQNLEDTQNFCLEMNVPNIIMLKDAEMGYVRIRSWNKDRFTEKRLAQVECVEHMLRLCQSGDREREGGVLKIESKSASLITETPPVNIIFPKEERLSSVMKRRCESQVFNSIANTVQRLSPKVRVEVLAINMEADAIKILSAYIDMNSDNQDMSTVIKRFPKHKKIINPLIDQIQEIKNNNTASTIILYSICDNSFKVLL